MSGNEVEDLVAALLFSEHPEGAQRITPSQGDGGMDVRIWTPDGWDVYQIKKFYEALDSDQKRQVLHSFARFQAEVASTGMSVKRWTVLMPWDPTREQRAWFHEKTDNEVFPTWWDGLTRLDTLASDHPAVADYFVGNGQEHIRELIDRAMRIGDSLPSIVPGRSLPSAAFAKVAEIEALLQAADPFYRYTLTMELVPDFSQGSAVLAQAPGIAYAKYHVIDSDRCVVIRAFYRTEGLAQLRPIRAHFKLTPESGTPEADTVREFWNYGTSMEGVPGSVIVVDDPTGLAEEGPGLLSYFTPADPSLPDLEVRLLDPEGRVLHRIPLVGPARSAGQVEGGHSLTAQDCAGVFTMVIKGDFTTGRYRYGFKFALNELSGKTPYPLLSSLRFIRDLRPGNSTVLGIQGAGELGHRVAMPEGDNAITQRAADLLEFARALLSLQQYTSTRVVFPSFADLTKEQLQRIATVADLLLGRVYESDSYRISITASGAREILSASTPSSAVLQRRPLTVDLGSYTIEFDIDEQWIFQLPTCLVADEELRALPDEEIVHLVPSAGAKMVYRLPVEHVPRLVEIE